MEIDPNRAVPFGLLVNELATNAVKHAFPDGKGCIVLSISREADDIELSVADDGVGVKVKAAVKLTERRGTDFVAIFVRQLGGRIIPSRSAAPGTTVRIRFPFDGGEPHSTKPLAA